MDTRTRDSLRLGLDQFNNEALQRIVDWEKDMLLSGNVFNSKEDLG